MELLTSFNSAHSWSCWWEYPWW